MFQPKEKTDKKISSAVGNILDGDKLYFASSPWMKALRTEALICRKYPAETYVAVLGKCLVPTRPCIRMEDAYGGKSNVEKTGKPLTYA